MHHAILPAALATLLTLASITGASAAGGSQLLPKSSLYTKLSPGASKAEIKAVCAEIVKRQDASAVGRRDAAQLYMHGMILGVSCLKVDYYKALVLARASGDAFTLKAALTYVHERADSGIDKAKRALEKFGK